jgi:hypothetical protein
MTSSFTAFQFRKKIRTDHNRELAAPTLASTRTLPALQTIILVTFLASVSHAQIETKYGSDDQYIKSLSMLDRAIVASHLLDRLEASVQKARIVDGGGGGGFTTIRGRKVMTFGSTEQQEKMLQRIVDRRKSLDFVRSNYPTINLSSPRVGNRGFASDGTRISTNAKVLQVIDERNCLIEISTSDNPLWLADFNTSNLVDGSILDIHPKSRRGFELLGTQNYQNSLGTTRQVWKLKFTNLSKELKQLRETAFQDLSRAWTIDESTVAAVLITIDRSDVTLEKEDGDRIVVKLQQLALADRKFISQEKDRRADLLPYANTAFDRFPGWSLIDKLAP